MASLAPPLGTPDADLPVTARERLVGALYDAHGRAAYTLALHLLGDRMAAEDVVQDVFVNLWRAADQFDQRRGTQRTWLLASVHHRCVDRLRGASGRARADLPLDLFAETEEDEDTFDIVAQRLTGETVRAALASLPPEQRQALELAYFDGLTHQQLATRLQAPLGTIKGRLRLGLEKLRALDLPR